MDDFHSGKCIFLIPWNYALKINSFPTRVIDSILLYNYIYILYIYMNFRCSRKNQPTHMYGYSNCWFRDSCSPLGKIIQLTIFSAGFKPSATWQILPFSWVICLQIIQLLVGWTGVEHRMISPKRRLVSRSSFQIPSSTSLTFRRRSMNKILLFKKSCCLAFHMGLLENLWFCTWKIRDFWKSKLKWL